MTEMFRTFWLALQEIPLGDKIALLVVCLSALSAEFARQAAIHAREANDSAVQSSMRAERLVIFRAISDFLHYCSSYNTMFSSKMVNGTRDLSDRIDGFKWEVRQHAFLHMSSVNGVIKTAIGNAHSLQRLLDRSTGPNPMPIDPECMDLKENIDKLVDWFSDQEKNLQNLFESYLCMNGTTS
jgi:hypothetical protein